MKQLSIFLFLVCASLCACHTTKSTTQVVTQSVHDTLYLNKLQYDSIFITQEHFVDRARDTILIKNSTVEYRYRLLRDTIYKTHVDSIPVVKEVTVTQEVKYVPSIYKWSLGICITLIVLFIAYIVFRVVKLYIAHK